MKCFNPKNRNNRREAERFKSFKYEELGKRDKLNLDIFWLKDEALEESANLPDPETIAADIAADLEAALEQFATIAEDLRGAPYRNSPHERPEHQVDLSPALHRFDGSRFHRVSRSHGNFDRRHALNTFAAGDRVHASLISPTNAPRTFGDV